MNKGFACWGRRIWLAAILSVLAWGMSAVAATENRPLRILLIDSYTSADPWSEELAHGFRQVLKDENLIAVYEVYQLGVRSQPGIRPSADDIKAIQLKLDLKQYDLLVASNNDAADLFLKEKVIIPNRTALLVMSYTGTVTHEQQKKFNMTGVMAPFQPYLNARLALRLKPDTPRIAFVVEASAEGVAMQKKLMEIPADLASKFTVFSGSEYTTGELLQKLSDLPPDSVLLFHSWSSAREAFPENSMTVLPRVRKHFPGLILGRFDTYIPLGSSGGNVGNGLIHGSQAGQLAIELLKGVRGEDIPLQMGLLDMMLDHSAIGRYGISVADLPAGMRIVNRPVGFFARYNKVIMIGMSVGLGILLLLLGQSLARRLSQRRLLELLAGLPIRIGVVDQHGRILYIHLPDDAGGFGNLKRLTDLPEVIREKFTQAVHSAFDGGKVELNYSIDGRFRSAEFTRLPVPNAFNTRAVIWISADRTALHQAHEEITRLADRFRMTLNSIGDGVIATDEREFVTLLNPAAAHLTGYTPEQAVGKKMDEIFNIVSYIDGSRVESPLSRALASGRTVELANHTDLVAQDGCRRHIADCASPLRDESGRIIGGVLVFRDVSEEYEQRDRLRMHSTVLKTVAEISKFSYFRCNADGTCPEPPTAENWPVRDGRPMPAEEWVSPEDRQDFISAWSRLLKGETEELCLRYSAGTGPERRYFEMRAVKSVNMTTRQPDFFGVIQDISEAWREECRYRDNFRMLQTIMDNLPGYIFVKDVNDGFRNIMCNRGLGELLGVDPRALAGKFDHELFPRDEAAVRKFHDDDMALVNSGKPLEVRESFIAANGETIVVQTSKNVLHQSDGTCLLIGMGFNITRQYQLEEAQKRTIAELQALSRNEQIINRSLKMITLENDLDAAVNHMLCIIGENVGADRSYIFRYEGDDQHYSSNEYEWVKEGIAPQLEVLQHVDMTELGDWNRILLDKREIVIRDLADVPEELVAAQSILSPQSIKSLLVCGIWLNDRLWGYVGLDFVREYHDFNGNDIHMVHNIVNLFLLARERVAQFNQVADSVSLQQQIMDNISIPILLVDLDYKVRAANPTKKINVELPVEQLLGTRCYDTVCKCGAPPEFCSVQETMRTRQTCSKEFSIGGKRLISTAQPIFDRNGNMQYILSIDIDITEVTRQKEELKIAMEQAQAADRAKSYFLATMSHELRTPLNAVIGFSELLQNSDIAPNEQREYLSSINCAGTALLNLINDILDLSKLEADQLPLSPSRTDVAELIAEVASVFRLKAREKQIALHISCGQIRYPIYVDNLRLRQILLNLIGNAIKFTHAGSVSILAEFSPSATDGTGVLDIRVADTGIGISPEDARRIFDPFVQSEVTRGNRVYEGSGLGLAISRRLVQRMGGKIELTSTPGCGSVFHINLQSIAFDTEALPIEERSPVEAIQGGRIRDLRILLVDDVPMNLKVLQAMLRKLNVESVCAGSGMETLTLLHSDARFDLILTDIWMPEMNGMELARQIHAVFPNCAIPVVAVTADTQIASEMPEMFDGVLLKPITQEKLQAIIRKMTSA